MFRSDRAATRRKVECPVTDIWNFTDDERKKKQTDASPVSGSDNQVKMYVSLFLKCIFKMGKQHVLPACEMNSRQPYLSWQTMMKTAKKELKWKKIFDFSNVTTMCAKHLTDFPLTPSFPPPLFNFSAILLSSGVKYMQRLCSVRKRILHVAGERVGGRNMSFWLRVGGGGRHRSGWYSLPSIKRNRQTHLFTEISR